MARSANYYNLDDFNDYKRRQGKCLPPRANVLAAANHIQGVFDAKKFVWGFMGGLSVLCLGYKREMPDLHIAYDDKDFERVKDKLESDQRVRLPTGVNPLLPFKILIWTGPDYRDQGCTMNATIELDLVPSGSCGTPPAGALSRNLMLVGLKTSAGQQMTFKSLNMRYLMATMLSYCKARDLFWDPRRDLLYLCKSDSVEVQRIRTYLNPKEVKEFFLGTSFFSRLPVADQRLCYRVLLGTEPPPTMAITPPAPQTLTHGLQRSRLSGQHSETRAPNSRYRNISGQRSSTSRTDQPSAQDTRPQSMDHLQDPRWQPHIHNVQCVNSAKPQSVSAVAAAKQARKSMPNLMAAHNTATRDPHRCSSQESKIPTSRAEPARTYSTDISLPGLQSQKGSLHVVSPGGEVVSHQQYFLQDDTPSRGRLHLVGPEGIYSASEKPQPAANPLAQHQRQQSAPPPQTAPVFAFELDGTASSKPTFIAELPAESIVPLSKGTPCIEALNGGAAARPFNPRTTSAPSTVGPLPASLVPGGLQTTDQHQPFRHNEALNDAMFGFSTRQTNAYKYSTYTVSQSEDTERVDAPIVVGTTSAYKAYRPFVVTEKLSRNDSVSSVYSPEHKRSVSNDSTASHDSSKLAKEYQELLRFEEGYGSH